MTQFIGRKTELADLNDLLTRRQASLVVLKGRRRVGKSRLAREFAKNKIFLRFSGSPPKEDMTAQGQRDTFAKKLASYCNETPLSFADWGDAFECLSKHILSNIPPNKQVVILFDEISWMGSLDFDFIPAFKTWWDDWDGLPHDPYPHFVLILCGSVSTWIEEKIINSTALYGRISLQCTLSDLSLSDAHQLLLANGVQGSTLDIFKILSITGGIPWYLEHIKSGVTADEDIKHLCFKSDGLLVHEYDKIFHDLFDNKGPLYKEILEKLAKGMCDAPEIQRKLKHTDTDLLKQHLNNLITSGFVSEHYTWAFTTGKTSETGTLYRLCDNYMRFYLKYIEPNLGQIKQNAYQVLELGQLPGWEAMMGFQVESLLLKNRQTLINALGLATTPIIASNPYVQKPTKTTKGCQIDYLIQTKTNNLIVCEFKFSKNKLGNEVIVSMEEKLKRFSAPKGFGVLPVLIHIGGVSKSVVDQKYFYRIIDMADFLS